MSLSCCIYHDSLYAPLADLRWRVVGLRRRVLRDLLVSNNSPSSGSSWSRSATTNLLCTFPRSLTADRYFGYNTWKYTLKEQVPVGLVAAHWGGTMVESWSSPDALEAATQLCAGEKKVLALAPTLKEADPATYRLDDPNDNPSSLWNGMIHPLLNMTFKAAIWYQVRARNLTVHPSPTAHHYPPHLPLFRAKATSGTQVRTFVSSPV